METLIIWMLAMVYYCVGVVACVWCAIDNPKFGIWPLMAIMLFLWIGWPYFLYAEIMQEIRRRKWDELIREDKFD